MVLGENLIIQLPQSLGREIHEALMAEHFESRTATLCQCKLAGADCNERALYIGDNLDSWPSLYANDCLEAQIDIRFYELPYATLAGEPQTWIRSCEGVLSQILIQYSAFSPGARIEVGTPGVPA